MNERGVTYTYLVDIKLSEQDPLQRWMSTGSETHTPPLRSGSVKLRRTVSSLTGRHGFFTCTHFLQHGCSGSSMITLVFCTDKTMWVPVSTLPNSTQCNANPSDIRLILYTNNAMHVPMILRWSPTKQLGTKSKFERSRQYAY